MRVCVMRAPTHSHTHTHTLPYPHTGPADTQNTHEERKFQDGE